MQIKERVFVQTLIERGLLYRDAKKRLCPVAQYVPEVFEMKDYVNDSNFSGVQTLITIKGKQILREVFNV